MRKFVMLLWAAGSCTPQVDGPVEYVMQDITPILRDLAHSADWIDQPVVSSVGPSWQLRAQQLRGYVEPDRVTVVDRSAAEPAWSVSLALVGFGASDAVAPVGDGVVYADGLLVENRRPRGVYEWYRALDEGLEQGFTLHQPVDGATATLLLEVEGGTPTLAADGVRVWTGHGAVDWAGLRAWDARRRPVAASIDVVDQTIAVHLDVSGAEWPVTVDPLLTKYLQIFDVGQVGAYGGFSVDIDGDRVLVGAPWNPDAPQDGGQAILLTRNTNAADDWLTSATFDPPTATYALGYGVALDGTTVIAAQTPPSGSPIFLWTYDAATSTWPTLTPVGDGTGTQAFGVTIEVDSDLAVAGNPGYSSNAGLLAFSQRIGDVWTTTPHTLAGTAGSKLGTSLDLDGRTFVAGAPGASPPNVTIGQVSGNFAVTSDNLWGTTGTDFGSSVAISAGWVAVGSPSAGKVTLFEDPSGIVGWTSKGDVPKPVFAGGNFGRTLAMYGTTLAVTDLPASGLEASVYLFELEGGTWDFVESHPIAPAGDLPFPVAISADLLVVGVPLQSGVAIWRREGDTWTADGSYSVGTDDPTSIDVDADQAVVGLPRDDYVTSHSGSIVFLERGSDGVWSNVGSAAGASYEYLGGAVGIQNRDYAVASAYDAIGGLEGQPHVKVFSYSGGSWSTTTPTTLYAHDITQTTQRFGASLDAEGNRILVGSPGWDDPVGPDMGRAELFERNASGEWGSSEVVSTGTKLLDKFGTSVAIEDRFYAVGSGLVDCSILNPDCGLVRLLEGSSPYTLTYSQIGAVTGDKLGWAMAADGDVLAVSAYQQDSKTGVPDLGGIHVYRFAEGAVLSEEATIYGPLGGTFFGDALAVDGDLLYVATANRGTVEVHRRNLGGTNAWGLETKITLTAGQTLDVAADEGTLAVSAATDGTVTFYTRKAAHLVPQGRPDLLPVTEDKPMAGGNVLTNDTDPDDGTRTTTVSSSPSHAKVFSLTSAGAVTYTPAQDYCADDSFTYVLSDGDSATVDPVVVATIDIICENDVPVAVPITIEHDEALAANEVLSGNIITLGVTDIEAAPMTLVSVTPKAGTPAGKLSFQSDGSFNLQVPQTPVTWSYDYSVQDGGDNEDGTKHTVQSTLTFHIEHRVPIIVNSVFPDLTGDEDTVLWLPAPGLLDPDYVYSPGNFPLTIVPVQEPQHGTVTFGPLGEFHYIPDRNVAEDDTFVFTVQDSTGAVPDANGQLSITFHVLPVPDPTIAGDDGPFVTDEDTVLHLSKRVLLSNDLDSDTPHAELQLVLDPKDPPAHGTLVDGVDTIDYVPDADYNGLDSFTYKVFDGSTTSANATVELSITAVNDGPRVTDAVYEDVQGLLTDLLQITDPEGDAWTAAVLTPPTKGVLQLVPNGAFNYTPNPGESGLDGFVYEAVDELGARSSWATVQIELLGGDTTPSEPTTPSPTGCEEQPWYADNDGDGYGSETFPTRMACTQPLGYAPRGGDCDDYRADRHPTAKEIAGDDLDQDCDGIDNTPVPVGCANAPGAGSGLLALALALAARRRAGRSGGARC